MDKVLLVIPAYNEGKNIERVVDHIKNDFPELDYVVVNDGSKDDTADICRRRGYNFIDLPVNLGLAGCFQTGMKYAWQKGYNYAVQFDGDGQHRPEYIQAMKEKMDEGYVYINNQSQPLSAGELIIVNSNEFPFCNREEKLVHAYVWKPPDRNGNLADYRGKDQRSYFRDASFQPEDDR